MLKQKQITPLCLEDRGICPPNGKVNQPSGRSSEFKRNSNPKLNATLQAIIFDYDKTQSIQQVEIRLVRPRRCIQRNHG